MGAPGAANMDRLAAIRSQRPSSASSRRPTSARPNRVRSTFMLTPPAPEEEEEEEELLLVDNTWLFVAPASLTSSQIFGAGFSRVLILNVKGWADSRLALEDVAYSFGFEASSEPDDASALPYAVEVAWRQQIINCVGPVLRGPDLLIVVQEMKPVPSTKKECTAFTCAARMIDCLSAAWDDAEMNGVPELAGVSVVLEGWPDTTETTLQCAWN